MFQDSQCTCRRLQTTNHEKKRKKRNCKIFFHSGTSWQHCKFHSLSSISQQPNNHGVSNPWPFSRSRQAVDENMAYRWSSTGTGSPSPFIELEARRASPFTYDPSAVPSLQMVDGSVVNFFARFIQLVFLTSSIGVRRTVQIPATCFFVAGSFARPSSPLCSFPRTFPLVSPPTRDGLYCGG